MSVLGNIIWLVFGGFFMALEYLVSGFLLCCTIIGIPFGLQVFKIGLVAFCLSVKRLLSRKVAVVASKSS